MLNYDSLLTLRKMRIANIILLKYTYNCFSFSLSILLSFKSSNPSKTVFNNYLCDSFSYFFKALEYNQKLSLTINIITSLFDMVNVVAK